MPIHHPLWFKQHPLEDASIYIYISIRAQGLPVALANRNTSLAPVIRDAIAVTLWSSLRAGIADHGNSGLVGGRKSGENVSRPSRSFL